MTMESLQVVRRRIRDGDPLRRRLILLTIATAAIGTLLGFMAYLSHSIGDDPEQASAGLWKHVLGAASDALALLVFETAGDAPESITFSIARLLTSVASVGGVLLFAWDRIAQSWWATTVSLLSDHTVVIGIGKRGRALLRTISPDEPLVLIDRSDDIWPVATRSSRTYAIVGDAKNAETLVNANVANARTVLILGGDDDENLAIRRAVMDQTTRSRRQRTRIIVRIDNPSLARSLNAERRFTDPDTRHRVVAFNEDRLAVLRMFESHVMGELAELRGLRRQHLVVVGHTGFALEAMEHFVRLSPYKDFSDFGIPRIDMLSANPDATRRRLAAMRPAMLAKSCIHADSGTVEWSADESSDAPALVDLHIWPIDEQSNLPEAARLRQIEPGPAPSVTAILVSAEDDSHAVATALRLRSLKRSENRWSAPIFVRAQNDVAVSFVQQPPTRALADRIIPVGLIQEIASLDEYVEVRDAQARQFHEAWHRATDKIQDRGARSTLADWQDLPNTVKARNRRAVDHLPSKLYSAGNVILPGALTANRDVFALEQEQIDALAMLEHQAWETDLRLDGWRQARVRNDATRHHDLLGTPYSALPPAIRHHDNEQLQAAAAFVLAKGTARPTIVRETRIAVIGHIEVSEASKRRLIQEIPDVLNAFGRRGETIEFVSILTPLAPGADTIGSEVLIEALETRDIPYRLIVVEAQPRHAMLHFALECVPQGGIWSLYGPPRTADIVEDLRAVANYQDGLAPFLKSGSSTTVDLQQPGVTLDTWMSDKTMRADALRRVNAYLVQRADVIVGLVRDLRDPGGDGGTREALNWAKEGVPKEFDHYGAEWMRRRKPEIRTITPVDDS
ncbi:MAG: NAD-binding protein [Gemmatimonadaceae bacterium]|nr:NAD-binding protein [Gemmatimonadaceae bacterium]